MDRRLWVLLALIVCLAASPLSADTLNSQLKRVEGKIHKLSGQIKQKKIEKSAAVSRLREQDKELEKAQSRVAKSQLKVAQEKAELDASSMISMSASSSRTPSWTPSTPGWP